MVLNLYELCCYNEYIIHHVIFIKKICNFVYKKLFVLNYQYNLLKIYVNNITFIYIMLFYFIFNYQITTHHFNKIKIHHYI